MLVLLLKKSIAIFALSSIAIPVYAQSVMPALSLVQSMDVAEVQSDGLSPSQLAEDRSNIVGQSPSVLQKIPATTPILPITKTEPIWPSPSLNPGVPSAFIASWGDVFALASAATSGNVRPDADGSFAAGFGLGNAVENVALELSGGCGSVKMLCSNGGFGVRLGRVIVNQPNRRIALTGAWLNGVQWSNEGLQDNIYSATLSYAIPLRSPGLSFGQTLQINAGLGNSTFAPYTPVGSEQRIGGFGSIGVELSPAIGVSAGWSGRGANAQVSYTPFRDIPITLNILGVDLFSQTQAGSVGLLTLSWRTNFSTPNFSNSVNF